MQTANDITEGLFRQDQAFTRYIQAVEHQASEQPDDGRWPRLRGDLLGFLRHVWEPFYLRSQDITRLPPADVVMAINEILGHLNARIFPEARTAGFPDSTFTLPDITISGANPMDTPIQQFHRTGCRLAVECEPESDECRLVASCSLQDPATGELVHHRKEVDLTPYLDWAGARLAAWHTRQHATGVPVVGGFDDQLASLIRSARYLGETSVVHDLWTDVAPLVLPQAAAAVRLTSVANDVLTRAKGGDPEAQAHIDQVKAAAATGHPGAKQALAALNTVDQAQAAQPAPTPTSAYSRGVGGGSPRKWGLLSVGHDPMTWVGSDHREGGGAQDVQIRDNRSAGHRVADVRVPPGEGFHGTITPPSNSAALLQAMKANPFTAAQSGFGRTLNPDGRTPAPTNPYGVPGQLPNPYGVPPTGYPPTGYPPNYTQQYPGSFDPYGQYNQYGNPYGQYNQYGNPYGPYQYGQTLQPGPYGNPYSPYDPYGLGTNPLLGLAPNPALAYDPYGLLQGVLNPVVNQAPTQTYDPATDSFYSSQVNQVYDPTTDTFHPQLNYNPYSPIDLSIRGWLYSNPYRGNLEALASKFPGLGTTMRSLYKRAMDA